jgi:hypothetical protein
MFLGWITDSQLITTRGEIEVTLDAFETSKQTYIISNTWDDSKGQFQEFWVLEYNSKTGLNASIDGKGLFNDKSGLVIYHVNNELQIETENGEEYAGIKYSNTSGNGIPVDLISFADSEHLIYTVGESTSLDIDDDHSNKIPYQITVVSENDGKLTLKIVYQTPTTTEA